MGKIYFNPETGKFWESTVGRLKPPDGFEYTGYKKDYRFGPRRYFRASRFCPECNQYHFFVKLHSECPPMYVEKEMEYTEKHGCSRAKTLVALAMHMGGKKAHYEMVEKLNERFDVVRWFSTLIKVDGGLAREAVKRLLSGADENEVEAWLISRSL